MRIRLRIFVRDHFCMVTNNTGRRFHYFQKVHHENGNAGSKYIGFLCVIELFSYIMYSRLKPHGIFANRNFIACNKIFPTTVLEHFRWFITNSFRN